MPNTTRPPGNQLAFEGGDVELRYGRGSRGALRPRRVWAALAVAALALGAGCSCTPSDATALRLIFVSDASTGVDGAAVVVEQPSLNYVFEQTIRADPARTFEPEERVTIYLPVDLDQQTVTVTARGLVGSVVISKDAQPVQLLVGEVVNRTLSLVPRCEDGVVFESEACDDGDRDDGDGCSGGCDVEAGWSCATDPETSPETSVCAPICGDLSVVGPEDCDDGKHCENSSSVDDRCESDADCTDGSACVPRGIGPCPASCRLTAGGCGDGELDVEGGEQCDDGDENSWDPNQCRPSCAQPDCGDGVHDDEFNEQCDDGDANSQLPNACRPSCTLPICGDAITDPAYDEECDPVSGLSNAPDAPCRPGCVERRCGDGIRDPLAGEACDFEEPTVGCVASTCQPAFGYFCDVASCKPDCGDGFVVGYESCDDGSATPSGGDGCSTICVLEPGWQCSGTPSSCTAVCGDGRALADELCDDGNLSSGDGCNAFCQPENGWTCTKTGETSQCRPTCGDGVLLGTEACDDANLSAGDGCNPYCQEEPNWSCSGAPSECQRCGNGALEGDEACDDGNGNNGDGCTTTCTISPGFACFGQPSVCQPTCNNGVINTGETCDDSNLIAGDGCDQSCRIEIGYTCSGQPSVCGPLCGDGAIVGTEVCDDGDPFGGDGCSASCQEEPGYTCLGEPSVCALCGDGITSGMETCDDANVVDGDGCTSCQVDLGWFCNTTLEPSACGQPCGNYFGDTDEACDDGNNISGDGCSAICAIEDLFSCVNPDPGLMALSDCAPTCGDGVVVAPATIPAEKRETCDDGNLTPGDGCGFDCRAEAGYTCSPSGGPGSCVATCGDGLLTAGESCDDGNAVGGDGCNASCVIEPGFTCPGGLSCSPVCGDALVVSGEGCDTGAFIAGDGCDDSCEVEPGYRCTGSPSTCVLADCADGFVDVSIGEECDDGALLTGDGCDDSCLLEPGWICADEPSVCALCGDQVTSYPETCDDDDDPPADGDGCSALCQVEPTYHCENNLPDGSVCATVCGNLTIGDASELCDDALQCGDPDRTPCELASDCIGLPGDGECRTRDGDGCSALCEIEPGWTCLPEITLPAMVDGPSVCSALCGDGVLLGAEPCDDGNLMTGDGCLDDCTVEPGWGCVDNVCFTVCGDGVVTFDEGCDDGNPFDGDGCSEACEEEPGFSCANLPGEPSECTGICGDGVLSAGESCDDGNEGPGDGCSDLCVIEPGWACPVANQPCQRCGDGVQQGSEQCDDGNLNDLDGCSAACLVEAQFCGDGSTQPAAPHLEVCDDGKHCDDGVTECTANSQCVGVGDELCLTRDGTGCDADCRSGCGDGALDLPAGEACDDGVDNADAPNQCREDCSLPACGDGITDDQSPYDEQCDEGDDNADTAGRCRAGTCVLPFCGDAILDDVPPFDEACDDGALNDDATPDACRSTCVVAFCGDGVVDSGEQCDDAGLNDDVAPDACRTSCLDPFCGDGVVDSGEGCDDGNNVGGDGCSETCVSELTTCGDGVVEPGEDCDDGNLFAGDGCAACQVESGFSCEAGDPSLCRCDDPTCPLPTGVTFADPGPVSQLACTEVNAAFALEPAYPAPVDDLTCTAVARHGPMPFDVEQLGSLTLTAGFVDLPGWSASINGAGCDLLEGGFVRFFNAAAVLDLKPLDVTGLTNLEASLLVGYRSPSPAGANVVISVACAATPEIGVDDVATFANANSGGTDACRTETVSLAAFEGCADLRVRLSFSPPGGTGRAGLDDLVIRGDVVTQPIARLSATTYEVIAQQCFSGELDLTCTWDDTAVNPGHTPVTDQGSFELLDLATCGNGALEVPEACDDGDTDDGDLCDPQCQLNAPTVTLTSTPALFIADEATETDEQTLASACTVTAATVDIDISHGYIGDLILTLSSPGGTNVTLKLQDGSDDDTALVGNYPLTLVPQQPLAAFEGESGSGTWTLGIQDVFAGDTGTLNSWSLNLYCQ